MIFVVVMYSLVSLTTLVGAHYLIPDPYGDNWRYTQFCLVLSWVVLYVLDAIEAAWRRYRVRS